MFRRSPSRSLSPWPSRSSPPSRARSSFPCRSLSLSLSLSRSRSRSRSGSGSGSGSGRESETLAHRGASTMRVDHPNSESRAATERKFVKLEHRHDKLMKANRKITKKINMLGDEIEHTIDILKEFKRADSLPTAVFLFVHQVEKAVMYFQFKTKAKQRHNIEHYASILDFADILRQDKELMSDFSNMGDSDIDCAVKAICWERTCTSQNEPVGKDWIYYRVYDVLRGDCVMDKDPEVEVKKLMESDPDEYDSYFLQQPANYKKMSKEEAYKKYSELVSITSARNKEALEEKRKSALATSARNKEAVNAKHKVRPLSGGNKLALHVEVPRKRKRDKASNKDWAVLPLQGVR